MSRRRILVCGGREFDDWDKLIKVLYPYLCEDKDPFWIAGGAKGADFLVRVFLKTQYNDITKYYKEYPADWKKYGYKAGPLRNTQMLVEGKPTLVIAFPGGSGTADMVRQARQAGVEVREIE